MTPDAINIDSIEGNSAFNEPIRIQACHAFV